MSEDQETGGELAEAQDSAPAKCRHPLEKWADMVRTSLRKSFIAAMEAGQRLAEAKEDHQFSDKEWSAWLKDSVGISASHASKLMTIGRYQPYRDLSHVKEAVHELPRDIAILHALTGMETESFALALESKQIRPTMSRAEGLMLGRGAQPPEQVKKQAEADDDHGRETGDDRQADDDRTCHCERCRPVYTCRNCGGEIPRSGMRPLSEAVPGGAIEEPGKCEIPDDDDHEEADRRR